MNNKDLIKKLINIKLLVMDIDGTLTDGSMFYSKNGEELKKFFVRDGMGIIMLKKADIKVAFLTSENSGIGKARSEKLKIDKLVLGSNNKSEDLENICNFFNIPLSETAYIGDDINDYHAIKLCGFSACPADANNLIKQSVDFVSTFPGGRGAVREIAEMILKAQNKSLILNENW